MKNKGWIRLHRKLMDDPIWLAESFTRGQAWVDLLLLANHTDGYIRKRGIRIDLKRGDVGWSETELSKRWRWSRGKVKRFLTELCSGNNPKTIPQCGLKNKNPKNGHQNGPQNKNVIAYYSIINYDRYQGNGPQNGPQTDRKQYRNKNVKNDKKETPAFFSLKNRYPNQDLIDKVFQAIASTRKSGKVAQSVLFAQLQKWNRYPVEQVEAGIRTYLEKNYAGQGKREAYLLGIIRNQKLNQKQPDARPPKILTPEKIEAMQNAN
jgi:hypothetical protein